MYGTRSQNGLDDLSDLYTPVPGNGGEIQAFRADVSEVSEYVKKSRLRRVDHYSRMALLAAGRALEDACDAFSCPVSKERTGVIVATGYGALDSTFSFLDSYIERGDKLAFPTHFSNSVHNAAAAHVSICYGITGPSLTVTQFDMSFFSALLTAGSWIETGKTDAVLVGTSDAWSDVMGYCMHGFSLMLDKRPYSFGEGSAFFLVTGDTGDDPKYGYFEEITMGRNLEMETLGKDGDENSPVFFSPASTAPCEGRQVEDELKGMVFGRRRAFSPTDAGSDAVFALKGLGKNCVHCIKLGQGGSYGKMKIRPAGFHAGLSTGTLTGDQG